MKEDRKELLRIAYTDELTGLYNRRYLKLNVRGMIQTLKARKEPLCLLVMDIDKFKGFNDTYGHLAGDEVLKGFSSILKRLSGKQAIPIRFAGDEFCVVIPRHDKLTGKKFGEKLVEVMAKTPIAISEDKKVVVSTSIGVASLPRDASNYEDLFKRADEALYKAKELGRAQSFVFPDDGRMIAPNLVTSLFPMKEMIGREEERTVFLDFLNGKTKMVPVISGSPGMGKTFLMSWVMEQAEQSSMQVIYLSGNLFWKFQPLSALFSSIAHFRENNANLFNTILKSIPKDQQEVLLVRLDIKEATSDEPFPPELILESISSFFIHIFEKGKTVLVLNDIQKIDEDSVRFFNSFLEQFMEKNLFPFIVIEKQPDDLTSMFEFMNLMPYLENRIQFIELNPLTEAECDQFITGILTQNPFSESMRKVIYSNTNGRPFFLQELLKNLLNSQKLVYSIDHWELVNFSDSDLTISLEKIAENRIKLLDDELRDTLSKAALIGDSFDLSMLSKLSGIDDSELRELLRKAENKQIIAEASGQEGDFSFINQHEKQALINLIDKEEQKKVYGKIVEIENTIHGGDVSRVMGRLMYHMNKGFLFRQASDLFRSTPTSLIGGQVSTSALARLQQSSFKKIAGKEEVLTPDDLVKSLTTVRNIKIAIQNLRLYPKTNKNVRLSVEKVFEDIEHFLRSTEAFSISSTPEMVIINGSEPPSAELGNLPAELYSLFNDIGLKGITFIRGLKFDELLTFLELPSQIKGESKDEWDKVLKDHNIEHILPDRKIYVAVGEKKIVLDGKEKVVLDQNDTAATGMNMSEEMLEQYRQMIEEFKTESEKLKSNLSESDVPTDVVLKLTRLLENSPQIGGLPVSGQASLGGSLTDEAGADGQTAAGDIQPDFDTLEQVENSTANLLLDLSSENKEQRAAAIARLSLLTNDIAKIVFDYLSSDNDLKSNRLAAQIVKKVGFKASNDFLSYISPSLGNKKLKAFLQVADIFYENDLLYQKLGEMLLRADSIIAKMIEKVVFNAPLDRSEKLLIDFLALAKKEVKYRLLKTAVSLKIKGLTSLVNTCLIPQNEWTDEIDEKLVEQAAFAAGDIAAPDDETIRKLLGYLKTRGIFRIKKPAPDNIRAAALLSLRKINPPELMDIIPQLAKDKNPKIAHQAKKLMS